MKKKSLTSNELTTISLGIAALISGGFFIYQLSAFMPIPGVKYLLMAPYLSMVIYILLTRVKSPYALLYIGITFGLIMAVMNIYMMLAILLTATLSQVSILPIKQVEWRNKLGASLFSAYTGLCALIVSKYMIGGIFEELTMTWILIVALVCWGFGLLGVLLASKIVRYLKLSKV